MTKLTEMLKYVSNYNDFYKNRIKEYGIVNPLDITNWPILTREELQNSRFNMFSEGEKIEFFNNNLIRMSSSGTAGMPIDVYWNKEQYYKSMLNVWRLRKQYNGIMPTSRKLTIISSPKHVAGLNNNYSHKERANTLIINQTLLKNPEYQNQIMTEIQVFSPEWIYARPTLLSELVALYKSKGIMPPSSIRYIEVTGELLTSTTRNFIQDFFGILVTNMYGTEELGTIAYECPCGNMHILQDNVFLEVNSLDCGNNASTGRALVTGLINTVIPLIRYEIGDILTINKSESNCECHNTNNELQIIHGRTINSIDTSELKLNSYMLISCIDAINNELDNLIKEYKFKFISKRKLLRCIFSLEKQYDGWKQTVEESFKRQIQIHMIDSCKINIVFEYREHIVLDGYKKYQVLSIDS